jgi:Type IV secretory system Conjugative DNA transfer
MPYRAQIDEHGQVARYKDTDTGETVSPSEFQRRQMLQSAPTSYPAPTGQLQAAPPATAPYQNPAPGALSAGPQYSSSNGTVPPPPQAPQAPQGYAQPMPAAPAPGQPLLPNSNLVQPGAQMLNGGTAPAAQPGEQAGTTPPSAGQSEQVKNLRLEGIQGHTNNSAQGYKTHGFLDATSIAILLPTLVLLALIIAAAHKKRLFPWQTIRTFNPPSGLMTPRDYERSYVCPPNLRRHGRLGKRNPEATWGDQDGIVLPFGFLARTHLPITIPLGRLPNKNMFIVAPSGSGKTTLMRAIIKGLLAKPCVVIALEAKANDPTLDEKRESFKHTLLPEAQTAGFDTLYFNPLDPGSVHWNPLDLDPITFASSIVQDINSLDAEEQHWAERDHGYITGLTQLLKWGAVMVAGEDENGQPADVQPLPCNPRGLMRLVNNRRNIVESLRRCKNNPDVPPPELNELTQTLSSIIRTDSDWDKNIQGVRGRLRMFKNINVLRCTEESNIDIRASMHKPTVLIFGAPASMGPDAESLASTFVYQLQNALHSRYGTASVLPLFAFFDEYQTLNMDIAGRLSAIVRGANGGLTIILQNISQIAQIGGGGGGTGVSPELKTIFSNSAIRVCLHNADESTAKFFSEEIGKHAIIVPGISDHYDADGFGIFPTSWNRIHSQQVVARVDTDGIKRMEKHHALIFLSPAGDPEFGELKPFMCDLRGIEEIARLHLLHNMAGRNGGALPGQTGSEGDPGAPAGGGQVPIAARIGSPVLANMMSPQTLEKAANYLHGQQQQMPPANAQGASAMGGSPMPAPAGVAPGMPGMPGIPGAHGAMPAVAAAVAGAAIAGTAAALAAGAMQPRPPFPGQGGGGGGGPITPQRPGAAPNAMPGQPAQAQALPAAPQANGVPTSDRVCSKCAKWPGKGRFCIECGTFVGQPGAAPAGATPVAQQPGMPMQQQAMPMQQPGMPMQQQAMPVQQAGAYAGPQSGMQPQPQPQQRPPVTSLNVDLNKYGVPRPGVPGAEQPGQQPMPRPQQPRPGSIEF